MSYEPSNVSVEFLGIGKGIPDMGITKGYRGTGVHTPCGFTHGSESHWLCMLCPHCVMVTSLLLLSCYGISHSHCVVVMLVWICC